MVERARGLRVCAYGLAGVLRLRALDRLAAGLADRDRNLARLALLGLRDAHLEHTALEAGGDRLGIDALGERQRPREAPGGPLDPVVALLALLVLGLALARDGENA